jgi:mediator of RNA polymerase II transcription subunit 14
MKAKCHIRIPLKSVLPNPTFDFLNQLHLFTSSIIAYFVNSRELKEKWARYAFQNVPKSLRGRPLNLPALYVQLGSILPSRHVAKRSRLPWAKPCIKIVFNGISGLIPSPVPPETQSADSISSPPKVQGTHVEDGILIAHGRLTHPIKSGLLGNQRIDEDISFHPENGSFALRLRAQIGRTSIDELVDRLQRVERLVEFMQVVNSRPKLRCESASLSTLQFSYSKYPSSSSNSSSLTGSSSECYLAAIDFSKPDDYSITFESENPHIRILDYLTKILNSNLSFEGVATLIPITLPVLRAFETIETVWADMPPTNTSEAIVVCRAVDQHVIRYNLSPPIPPSSDSTNPSPELERQRRHILLEIRLFHRGRNPWWNVRRIHTSSLAQSQPKDEIDAALAEVWNENLSGEGLVVPANPSQGATQGDEEGKWWGMQCSAIAPGDSLGAEKLIGKVDAVMRGLALNGILDGTKEVDVPQPQAQAMPQAPMLSQAQRPPQGAPNNNPNVPHVPMQMGNLGQGVGLGLQMGNPGHGQGQQMPQAQMRMQQGQMQGRNMNMMRPGMKPMGQGQNINMNIANLGNRNQGPNAPGGKSGEAIVID